MTDAHNILLLVDDDPFLTKIYEKKTEKSKFELHVASDANQALSVLREGLDPKVILVDIEMQGMNGIEFMQTVRKEGIASDAKFIVLSNQSDEDVKKQAQEIGIERYLLKSETLPSEVLEEIEKITA